MQKSIALLGVLLVALFGGCFHLHPTIDGTPWCEEETGGDCKRLVVALDDTVPAEKIKTVVGEYLNSDSQPIKFPTFTIPFGAPDASKSSNTINPPTGASKIKVTAYDGERAVASGVGELVNPRGRRLDEVHVVLR